MEKSTVLKQIIITANNLMSILDMFENFETELRFHNVDFDKFLENFAWTREEYETMWSDLSRYLSDEEVSEQINYCHAWQKEV